MLDYLLRNGTIIDGSGRDPFESNIGIEGDRISYIGNEDVEAAEVIDVEGLFISPGFIDAHAHSEFTLIADGRGEGKILQGVTTEINGNCGLSAAPLYGEALEERETELEELGITRRWSSFGEYFEILQKNGIGTNFVTLCGHGNLRGSVLGYRACSPDQGNLAEMKRLLSEAIRDGARGLSTGLAYAPGVYSETRELIELARVLSPSEIYTSHIRSEGDRLTESVEEVLTIARETGVDAHISHIKTAGERNWEKIDEVIRLIGDALDGGINLTCDRYPYIAACTSLDTVLPEWVLEGGVEEELRRLRDQSLLGRVRSEIRPGDDDYWKNVCISSVRKDVNRWMEGKSLHDIAECTGSDPVDMLFELLVDEGARVDAIFFSMSEENLKRFLTLPYTMVGSDSAARCSSGPTSKIRPHPRTFGTFPRFLGPYVRDKGLMDLPEAIKKITYLPAATFNLRGRGLIREGYFADIVVFDYARINDRATYSEPYLMPEGVEYVFINGSPALYEGMLTRNLSGRVLR
jgi:N-acyl-D-amino-acid deacylase